MLKVFVFVSIISNLIKLSPPVMYLVKMHRSSTVKQRID